MSDNRPTVIFDLDSTLNDLHYRIYESFKANLQLDRHYHSWKDYDLSTSYPFPFDEILGLIERFGLLEKSMPLAGAINLFAFMRKHFHIAIITARQWLEDARPKTERWLQHYDLMPDFLEISLEKDKVIRERVGQCLFFMDDNPDTLTQVLESGTAQHVATLKYAWTKSLPREILQFETLQEVEFYLKKLMEERKCLEKSLQNV